MQKTEYEMRSSDWSSDGCSADLQRSQRRLDRRIVRPLWREQQDRIVAGNRAPRIRKHRQVLRRDPAVRGESGDHVGTPARKRAIHKARRITLGGGKAQAVGIAHRRPFGTFEEFEVSSEEHTSELKSLMRL